MFNNIKQLMFVARSYQSLVKVSNLAQGPFLLLFRLSWGWQFYQTGMAKLINHSRVVEFFLGLGIPAPELNAWFVGGLECFGGILLFLGLCSRPIALLLSGNMLVAYLSVEEDRLKLLNILSDPGPFLSADPFFFLLASSLVLVFGPGRWSIDSIIEAWWNHKQMHYTSELGSTKSDQPVCQNF